MTELIILIRENKTIGGEKIYKSGTKFCSAFAKFMYKLSMRERNRNEVHICPELPTMQITSFCRRVNM